MTNSLRKLVAEYLDGPGGAAVREAGTIWFRWNTRTQVIEPSGAVLKSTPEQMSRPGTAVFLRAGRLEAVLLTQMPGSACGGWRLATDRSGVRVPGRRRHLGCGERCGPQPVGEDQQAAWLLAGVLRLTHGTISPCRT